MNCLQDEDHGGLSVEQMDYLDCGQRFVSMGGFLSFYFNSMAMVPAHQAA